MGSCLASRKRGPLDELGVPNLVRLCYLPVRAGGHALSTGLRWTLAAINKTNSRRGAHQPGRSLDDISNYIFW